MTLSRLDPPSRMGDQVFEALHAAIMNGSYPAGHRLRIREVATELGTSVMPVREAIRRLEELGLIESSPNRGAAVKGFTPAELLHVYAVRRFLEPEGVSQGVARVSEKDLAQLREAYTQMEQALSERGIVDYLDADERFLDVLYQAVGNPVLVETIHVLWQRCRAYKIVGTGRELTEGHPSALLTYQARLLEAAEHHDAALAKDLSAASIDDAMHRIRQALPAG